MGIDLTTTNIDGKQKLILREIIKTIKLYGFPKKIRTDNETCFTSKLIKLALKSLLIKRQTTDIACPWQNGRIERSFCSFKQKWRQVTFNPQCPLQTELYIYQIWYNVIRPHSNLTSRTSAEAFNNKQPNGKNKLVSAWDGVLSGFYFPD